MSVAGKREGLNGEQSVLFYEAIRIIKEMRCATDGKYPRFIVWENVPGAYSSAGGSDFREVLSEIVKIKDEWMSVPMPESGKWLPAGEIVGDGFSIAYRTLDAQFWGVAQRRRRCYLVADFASERAGSILFESEGLPWDSSQGFGKGQGTADHAEAGAGASGGVVLNDQGGSCMDVSENVTGTLRAQEHGHPPIVFEPGAVSRIGGHAWSEAAGALRADMGDNRLSVAIENHPADSRIKVSEDGIVQTLPCRMGTGGGNVPLVASFMGGQGTDAGSIAYSETVAPTIRGQAGGNSVPMVMNERQYALTVGEDVANTLTGTDYKGTQCVFEPVPQTLKIRSGCEGGGKGALIQEDRSATLSCNSDQTVFVPKAYGICSDASNAMRSGNPDSGIYEADTSRTLDANAARPDCNQGGIAVVSIEGNGVRPSHKGSGIGEDVSFTLNTIERHAVCYQDQVGALCASDYKFPQQQQIDEGKVVVENYQHSGYREVDMAGTLKTSGGTNGGGSENMVVENQYIVRRLTPTECALLQGFPPNWCEGLETPEPTEEEIRWWSEVFETYRKAAGTSSKAKSRSQIIKWLRHPHTDSAEYKMWGNGVALPCVRFVLAGIRREAARPWPYAESSS
jgi:DNA (cytosine-5)-methyltransferase 1